MSITYWLNNWKKNLFDLRSGVARSTVRKRRAIPQVLETLEDRVLLAATTFDNGTLTIDINNPTETVNVTNDGTNISINSVYGVIGAGNSFATGTVTRLVVTDLASQSDQTVIVGGSADYTLPAGFEITGVEAVSLNRAISTGAADISVTTGQYIQVQGTLSTTDGDIFLSANQQADRSSGDFFGISVGFASVTATGTGTVTLLGTGGLASSNSRPGVVLNSATVSGSSTTVTGVGADNTLGSNFGVSLNNGSTITSTGGNVVVTGTGGNGDSGGNVGVAVGNGSTITATGVGTVSVTGTGGGTGQINTGVSVFSTTASITSAGGDVTVLGTGGFGVTSIGVSLTAGMISAGGSGQVNVTGIATTAAGGSPGVALSNTNPTITSSGGKVTVTASSNGNAGISMTNSSITSGLNGDIEIVTDNFALGSGASVNSGSGQTTIRTYTAGTLVNVGGTDVLTGSPETLGLSDTELDLISAGTLVIGDSTAGAINVSAAITHNNNLTLNSGANVAFTQSLTLAADKSLVVNAAGRVTGNVAAADISTSGTGAVSLTARLDVQFAAAGASISAENGNILLSGNQQETPSSGNFAGVHLVQSSVTTSGTGTITLLGRGGDSAGLQLGVYLSGATVSGNAVTINGTGGGNTGTANDGVEIVNNSAISTTGGDIQVIGTGGGTTGESSYGISIYSGATVSATGDGNILIRGNVTTTGQYSDGVYISSTSSPTTTAVTSTNGSITIEGTGGAGSTQRGFVLGGGAQVSAGGTGTLTVTGTAGATGSGSNGVVLGEGNAQLASNGGKVTVTAITNTAVGLFSSVGAITSGGSGEIEIITNSAHIVNSSNINSGTGKTTIRPYTPGTLVNLGGADVVTGPTLTLGLTDTELDQFTAGTLVIGDANTGAITVSAAITHGNNLTLNSGAGLMAVAKSVAMGADKSLVVDVLGSVNLLAGGNLTTTGTGSISVTTQFLINIQSSTISTVNGDILLSANQQTTPIATEGFTGVYVGSGTVSATGTGAVTILGRGGNGTGNVFGIWVNAGTVSGHSINITGTGGTGSDNATGFFLNADGNVRSTGGGITVTGYGGATTGLGSIGVSINSSVSVGDTGSGAVNVVGVGGEIAGSGSLGILLNSGITSGGGNITVTGTARGTGSDLGGISMYRGAILAGGTGTVTVTAQGMTGPGLWLQQNAAISSNNGAVDVTVVDSPTGKGLVTDATSSLSSGGNKDLRIIANNIELAGILNSGTGLTSITPYSDNTPVALGGADVIDASPTLGLTATEMTRITAGTLVIGDATTGNITFSAAITPTTVTQLELVTGTQIVDSNATGVDVTVARLGLTASTGIGVGNPLETTVSNLEATTTTGGIFVSNTGALSIGGVNGTLNGLRVTGASGGIDLLNTSGNVRITTGGDFVIAPGDVSIKTLTSGDIITAGNDGFFFGNYTGSVNTTGGNLTLDAADNIDLGESGSTNVNGDLKSYGNLLLKAGGSVTIDDQASVQTLNAGSSLTIIAGTDVSMLRTNAAGSLLGSQNDSGGMISITTGAGGTFTLNGGTSNPGIIGGRNGLRVAADNVTILDDIDIRAGGNVTLTTVTAGRPINLGTETSGSLSLTNTEVSFVTQANAMTIGDSNSGSITFSAAITPNPATLNLITGASILSTTSSGTDVTVSHLNITAPTGIGSSSNPLNINAATLGTNSQGGNGNQYLNEFDSVELSTTTQSLRAGTGTITLVSGNFLLTGGTISAGTLTGRSGSFLGGTGTVDANVNGGLPVYPGIGLGNKVGTITINGDFTPTSSIGFDLLGSVAEAGVDYDQIRVNGLVDLSGSPGISVARFGITPAPQTVATLISNDGTDPATPSSVPEGQDIFQFKLHYNGGTGNDVVLVESSAPTVAYVSSSFTGNAGQVIADVDLGTAGDQPGVVGANAFTTVAAALAAVASGGTVVVNGGTYAETVSVSGTTTLKIGGADAAQTVTFNSLATVSGTTLNLAGTSSLTIGDTTDTAIAGVISGSGSWAKQGSSIVTVSGNNTYTGATTVSSGTLRVTANNGLGTTAGGTTVATGATLDLRSVNYSTAEAVELQSAALANSNGTTTFAGAVTMTGNSNYTTSSSVLILSGAVLGPYGVNKTGTGTLRLSNTGNTFASVNISGGTLQLGASGVIPDTADIVNSSQFDVNGFDETLDSLAGTGNVTNSQSTLATVTLGAGNNNASSTLNGSIGGAINLVKTGTGRQVLSSASSTYTGTTTINNGTLAVVYQGSSTATQALGSASAGTIVNAGGVLEFQNVAYTLAEPVTVNGGTIRGTAGGDDPTYGSSSFGGPITLATDTSTFNVTTAATLTVNGVIGGDQALTKTGVGTLVLAGANTYSGNTTINSGTLIVNGSLDSASTVQINNGGTLGGSGTINGAVNVASGGQISPGNSPGIQNSGSISFAFGSTFFVEVNGATPGSDHDQLNVTGTVSLGNSTLNASGTISSNIGQQIVIINNDSDDAIVGTFNNIPEGSIVVINGLTFEITYQGGTNNNDVVLTEVYPSNDVSVTITDDQANPAPGGTIIYTITVTNSGPFTASSTAFVNNVPTGITISSWTSLAAGGATGNTASGSGDIADTLVLPAGASVTYTVTATISASATGSLTNIATVSQAGDTDSSNDSATDTDVLDNFVTLKKLSDAAESSTNGKFQVSQEYATAHDTIVTYSINGNAQNGSDYQTLTGSVTIPAGFTSADIDVLVLNDLIVEDGETIELTLTGFTQADPGLLLSASPSDLTATVNLTDDDTNVLTIEAPTITETNADQTVTFTITSPNAVQGGFDVVITTTDGTAGSADYALVTTTVHFAGTAGETQSVSVTIKGDTTVEANETFSVALGAISNTSANQIAAITTGASATATIVNDDTATYTISNAAVTEGGDLSFTVSLSNPVDVDTTVNVTFTDGTTSAGDFNHASVPVTFLAGSTTAQVFTVATAIDNVVEANETLTASLSLSTPLIDGRLSDTTDTGTGTINNDDTAIYTITDSTVTEGGDLSFTVSLSNPVDVDTTINVTFTDVTTSAGDFDHRTVPVTFLAGSNSAQVILIATVSDSTVEADETFSAHLALSAPLTGGRLIDTTDTGAGTITNDDTATYTISDATVTEGGELSFTVSLSNPVDVDTTINVTFTDGTTSTGDFDHTPIAVTFLAGSNTAQVIVVATTADNTVEADETLTVSLALSTPLTGGRLSDTTDTATGTITNDDTATYTISDASVTEGGELSFTVSLSNPVDVDTTVNLTFTDGSTSAGDFDHTPIAVTFLAGNTTAQVIVVPTIGDSTVEADETFTAQLALSAPLAGGRLSDTTDTGTGMIVDDDTATFTINNVTVNEADGALVFDLATDNPLDIDVTIDVTFTNGSTTGADYASVTQQITFLAGQTTKQVTVAVNDDNIVEATENFSVALSTATPLGGRSVDLTDTGTGTIIDNDAAIFTIDDVTASEGDGTLVFNLVTDRPLDIDVTITVTFTAGSATGGGTDFTSTTQQITFLAGETSKQVSVAINNDAIVEATESFTAALSTSSALDGRSVTTSDTATGTITDDDVATVSVSKVTDGIEANSPTNGKFRITQSAVSSSDTVITYTIGGTATAGSDYTPLTGTATIPAGQTTVDINVLVLNDATIEDTETVIVTLTGLGAHDPDITLDVTEATVNITDSDKPAITSGATASIVENTPATTVILNVDADPAPLAPGHTLSYSLSGPDADVFEIDSATGEIRFKTSPNFEAPGDQGLNNVYQVTVTATADTNPAQSSTQDLTITVTPENDLTPVFTNPAPTFDIAENSADGTVVGSVPATDGDLPAQTLTYSIVSGNLGGAFTINPATGEIKVASSTSINYETVTAFTLTVRVTDNTSVARTADAIVTINVTNVVEDPTITIPNAEGTYHLGKLPAFVSPDASFVYDDVAQPNYDGATLTVSIVSGRSRRDKLTIVKQGDSAGQINTRGRKVFLGSTQIGTFKGGRGRNADLVVTLNANATTAGVASLIRRVNFQAKDGVGRVREVQIQVTNIAGVDSNVATRNINVVPREE